MTVSHQGAASPAFAIRDLFIDGRLVLAPLSGYNDQPFRRLCREFGAALTYTGLLSASGIIYGSTRTDEMLRFREDLPPLACQIFGSDVDLLEAAARRVAALRVATVDLNLGCAEPKITKGGSGAALMRDPAKVGRIFTRLTEAVAVPVTGKIRLGWDAATRNYRTVARAMEDNGAALIAVHGRTAEQGYRGEADWDAIAELKRAASVPVLASGDVRTPADVERVLALTGCDGVMIGRAAIGNPWIFQGRARGDVPWAERQPVIARHLQSMVDFHGAYLGIRRFRKHLKAYLRQSGVPRRVRRQLLSGDDVEALLALLEQTV